MAYAMRGPTRMVAFSVATIDPSTNSASKVPLTGPKRARAAASPAFPDFCSSASGSA